MDEAVCRWDGAVCGWMRQFAGEMEWFLVKWAICCLFV